MSIEELYTEMNRVMASSYTWEAKFDIVFELSKRMKEHGVHLNYCDPDTTYREDVCAYFNALAEYLGKDERY